MADLDQYFGFNGQWHSPKLNVPMTARLAKEWSRRMVLMLEWRNMIFGSWRFNG